jgi:hypothetical protein
MACSTARDLHHQATAGCRVRLPVICSRPPTGAGLGDELRDFGCDGRGQRLGEDTPPVGQTHGRTVRAADGPDVAHDFRIRGFTVALAKCQYSFLAQFRELSAVPLGRSARRADARIRAVVVGHGVDAARADARRPGRQSSSPGRVRGGAEVGRFPRSACRAHGWESVAALVVRRIGRRRGAGQAVQAPCAAAARAYSVKSRGWRPRTLRTSSVSVLRPPERAWA